MKNTRFLYRSGGVKFSSKCYSTVYVPSKTSINVFFSIDDFYDINLFYSKINFNLFRFETYTVFLKIRYSVHSFFMVGAQFPFICESLDSFNEVYNNINMRLEEYLSRYSLSDDEIIYIQVTFKLVNKLVYSDLILSKSMKKELTNVHRKNALELITVPVVNDEEHLGLPLPVLLDNNNKIISITANIKGFNTNFLHVILSKSKILTSDKNKITDFDNSYNFYYIKSKIDYVLAVKQSNDGFVDKIKFSLNGVMISRITDKFHNDIITRTSGSKVVHINKENIVTKVEK